MRRFQAPFNRGAGAEREANPAAPANPRVGSLLLRPAPPREPPGAEGPRAASSTPPTPAALPARPPAPAEHSPPALDGLVPTSCLPEPFQKCFPWLYFILCGLVLALVVGLKAMAVYEKR